MTMRATLATAAGIRRRAFTDEEIVERTIYALINEGAADPAQDVIVAEQYKQGGGAAANSIGAWSQINLITPLPGVESVVVAQRRLAGDAHQRALVASDDPCYPCYGCWWPGDHLKRLPLPCCGTLDIGGRVDMRGHRSGAYAATRPAAPTTAATRRTLPVSSPRRPSRIPTR